MTALIVFLFVLFFYVYCEYKSIKDSREKRLEVLKQLQKDAQDNDMGY